MDNSVAPRIKLALKWVGIASALNPTSVVSDPDQGFLGDANGLQTTKLKRINSNANINGIDGIRHKLTVEENYLPDGERYCLGNIRSSQQ